METLLFAGMAIAMFLFGFITHWSASSDERKLLRRYRQHARELNRVEARRQALEAQRRQWGG
ncbi:MAG: hypothetical protein PVS3B3_26990 [Ktedonobacteraceae bacterium]